jgi:hypothetical protein
LPNGTGKRTELWHTAGGKAPNLDLEETNITFPMRKIIKKVFFLSTMIGYFTYQFDLCCSNGANTTSNRVFMRQDHSFIYKKTKKLDVGRKPSLQPRQEQQLVVCSL